jgi:hypothetical protein
MLQPTSTTPTAEQLLTALISSIKLLLVSLALVVLFLKAFIGFGMVALAALNLLAEWIVSLVCSSDEMRSFFFAATR